jgi:hypothetical protein
MYSDLRDFFVGILGVHTVTASFLMKQLATAAKSTTKTHESIKAIMLALSEMLDHSSNDTSFRSSIEILDQSAYLPCRLKNGRLEFRSKAQSFFIVDNEQYAQVLQNWVIMLDFTYEQMNSLHRLVQLLGLGDHYLARHVHYETSAEARTESASLTAQLRQCAYAISW